MKDKTARQSNFELLRIFAMLMIILYHINVHCIKNQLINPDSIALMHNGFFTQPIFYKKLLILQSFFNLGYLGDALFILISGYFLINKENIDIKKSAIKMLSQLGIAILILMTISEVTYHIWSTKHFVDMITLKDFNSSSWFIGYYFWIILIAKLFLNKYLQKIDKKEFETFLITMFFIISISWAASILQGLSSELITIATGVFLYSLGGYMKRYNLLENISIFTLIIIIIVLNVLVYISFFYKTQVSIEKYKGGDFHQNLITYEKNEIFNLIVPACVFEIFRRIKMKNLKVINFIASSTLMIYLIHDNQLFYSIWNMVDWITLLHNSPLKFLAVISLCAIGTFSIGFISYLIYLLIMKIIKKIHIKQTA